LRAEKTAFFSLAVFMIPLRRIAVAPGGKNRGMSSIDSGGSIPDARAVGKMSAIADAYAA
jgi:hypothetical protein